mmetsp:Transcript_13940/g.23167  ORF Transcript_13940/g.23167 Transcript_13940/m.23167 type:complete len:344 (-) Transcript_13940:148-1179(-)
MSLDRCRWSLVGNALNDVRVQRSLEKPVTVEALGFNLFGFLLEDMDKSGSNDLALLFWVSNSLQETQESVCRINASQVDPTIFTHALQNILGLILTQATIVNHDSMETITNGPCHQDSSDSRVHTSTDGSHHMPCWSHLFADFCDKLIGIVCHDPVWDRTSNTNHKILQQILSEWRVSDFRVKLKTPEALLQVLDSDKLSVIGSGNSLEPIRNLTELISVRHPHLAFRRETFKEWTVASLYTSDNRLAVFMLESWSNLTPKDVGQLLHTVADSQDGNAALLDHRPDGGSNVRCAFFIDTRGATGKNNGSNGVLCQNVNVDQTRIKLTIYVQLTDTTGDEMGVL